MIEITLRRREALDHATAFLRQRGILVHVHDREAPIRRYRVTGKRDSMFLEDVVDHAIAHGMQEPA